jgi:hypothetical protein
VRGVVGDHAERAAFNADKCRDHPDAELRSKLENGVGVGQAVDGGAHVVDAETVLRDHVAQERLVGRAPIALRALEVGEVLLGGGDGFDLVGHRDVDDAVGHLHRHGADLGGFVHAEPAAFDHGRPAHPDVRVGGGDDDVAAAEDGSVAGEAVARVDGDERYQSAQVGEEVEGEAVEAGYASAVGVAGPAATAFGEEDDR